MLIAYIATGILFMLLPGTFVGVMNLMTISSSHTAAAADAGWIQAHGHAQIFGWLGTFILGIGYYTIPRLRLSRFSPVAAWTYALWTAGVGIRWAVGSWPWNWRVLFPLAGVLELAAVAIFCVSALMLKPRAEESSTWRTSVRMIVAAGWAMAIAVAVGTIESFIVAMSAAAPVFPFDFNQRYLVLITWGFVVPFAWGFTTRWIPPLLGLRKTHKRGFVPALVMLLSGVALALAGQLFLSAIVLTISSLVFIFSLRLWEHAEKEPKLRGVHASTPLFLKLSYAWLVVAAVLGTVAAALPLPNGYAGASRHALTVGFFAVMVFSIGPRILPAFFGVRRLWSTTLMAVSLTILNAGCALRVVSQILAHEGLSSLAWKTLPLSALIEMTAFSLFAFNMMMTLTTGSPLEGLLEAQREREAAGRA